ncbi:flagellar motor switch protein FliG [Phycicoccus sp.]|mgnify:CR=1 FL=1|uniref:flagellar motor switch protein FliG n=1 Tax=Phycicoccus sp. TaxID=1902410 RepID=UPI002B9C0B1B|nr:flagellar motor switch protein FliG [Phycicoccus sp.]HMM96147.1 flagellar motor switch protein FliG [Phycicoccus sp.]
MTTTAHPVSGLRKAALLLIQLGPDQSAPILRSLRPDEIEALMAEVAAMDVADEDLRESVIHEFEALVRSSRDRTRGGFDIAEEMLVKAEHEQSKEILGRLSTAITHAPFASLRTTDGGLLRPFLEDEHPQTIALVLAHLSSEQAALVLSGLGDAVRADVAHRLAVMDRTTPEVVRVVEQVLRRGLDSLGDARDHVSVGGLDPLVGIMNRSQRETERSILQGIEERDPSLAENLRSKMFAFTDIVDLDDRTVQLVLRQVDAKELALALKGATPAVRDKVFRNMSERSAAALQEEVEVLGPVRTAQVEEARSAVVKGIRALEDAGEIVISRAGGGDDLIQ